MQGFSISAPASAWCHSSRTHGHAVADTAWTGETRRDQPGPYGWLGVAAPPLLSALEALGLGAVSYGASIVLFIVSAQRLGASRGQVLFATAPFIGAALSLLLPRERFTWPLLVAAILLAGSIGLLPRSRHTHYHIHEARTHIHAHCHDDLHHTHVHPGRDPSLVHVHVHTHEPVAHEHPHVPDIHHRHAHLDQTPPK